MNKLCLSQELYNLRLARAIPYIHAELANIVHILTPLDIERIVLINSLGPSRDPLAGVKLRVVATRKAEHTMSNIASRAKRRKTAVDQQLTATKAPKRKASTAQLNLFAFFEKKKNKT